MSPEDVEEMPIFWIHAANAAQEAEHYAREEYQKRWPNGRPGDVPSWRKPVREE